LINILTRAAVAAPCPIFTGSSWFQGWDIAGVELARTVSETIAIASAEIPSAM